MSKDPAVLIYFDKWISSTNGMRADFRAWYFDLIVHQYDKGYVPTDLDTLAGICRVRPSELENFKQMLEQVVKQKFELLDGKYYNKVIGEVLTKRQDFKDKRERSGNIGVIIKSAKALSWCTDDMLLRLKDHLFSLEIKEILTFKNNQVLEHLLKLYINEDEDVNIIKGKGIGGMGEKPLGEQETIIFKHDNFKLQCENDTIWQESLFIKKLVLPKNLSACLADFNIHLIQQAENKTSPKDYKSHFTNWLSKKQPLPSKINNGVYVNEKGITIDPSNY